MGPLRLLLGPFDDIKGPLYQESKAHPWPLPGEGNRGKRIYDRELEGFREKVAEIDEMGEKGKKLQKWEVFIWIMCK